MYRRGLYVIPVHPDTRTPLLPWGHIDDYGHPEGERFRGGFCVGSGLPYSAFLFLWWDRWPGAGGAVLTGRSRLLVLDVDPRHGGVESLARLAAEIDLPATFTVRTPGGGVHLYWSTSRLVRSTISELGAGLDVRSYRGLAVCPPTPGYEIIEHRSIAPVPTALLKRCPKPRRNVQGPPVQRRPLSDPRAQATLTHALTRIREAVPSTRHSTLYGQARYTFGVTAAPEVDALLLTAAMEIGLPEAESRRAIADARRKAGI